MRLLILAVILLAMLADAYAQPADSSAADDPWRVSVLTMLPGDQVYSRFGHSAFRVQNRVTGEDLVFNYGTFSFQDPLFVPKFVYGRLDYMLSVERMSRTVVEYERYFRRSMIEQHLNLTPAQEADLVAFLFQNAQPENRTYRYDFIFDNCATRLPLALNRTLGEAVAWGDAHNPGLSFRDLLDLYVADASWLNLGFDLILGQPTDRTATPEEVTFLPLYLRDALASATITDGASRQPLVAATDTLIWFTDAYEAPPQAFPWPTLLITLLTLVPIGLTVVALRQPGYAVTRRWPDVTLFAVIGVLGLFFAFMWFGTLHGVTGQNWNLMWLLPLHVFTAWLVGRASPPAWTATYLRVLGAWHLLVVPLFFVVPQDLPWIALPITVLLALRCWALSKRQRDRAPYPQPPG
ncbi:MAG: DUF4105 domain-containing protein [Bacteroidota bacterium]